VALPTTPLGCKVTSYQLPLRATTSSSSPRRTTVAGVEKPVRQMVACSAMTRTRAWTWAWADAIDALAASAITIRIPIRRALLDETRMVSGNPFHVAEQRDAGRSPSHLVRQLYN
jgi:hypothetical protein